MVLMIDNGTDLHRICSEGNNTQGGIKTPLHRSHCQQAGTRDEALSTGLLVPITCIFHELRGYRDLFVWSANVRHIYIISHRIPRFPPQFWYLGMHESDSDTKIWAIWSFGLARYWFGGDSFTIRGHSDRSRLITSIRMRYWSCVEFSNRFVIISISVIPYSAGVLEFRSLPLPSRWME
jgi:hypothetical protein